MAFGESFTEQKLAFLVVMSFKVNAIGVKQYTVVSYGFRNTEIV